MFEITIEQLLELCRYGTDIRIVRSDNGGTVIERLSSLANSKDKRQVAKWEAFRRCRCMVYIPIYRWERCHIVSATIYRSE